MKKGNVLFVVLMAVTTSAFAQGLTLGMRGGFNYTTVSGEDFYHHPYYVPEQVEIDQSKSFKPGFNIGIDAIHQLNNKMALQAELFYSSEGYKGKWSYNYEGLTSGKFTEQYNLLNLPVFFKYNFTKHLYVMGGPQFSFLLSAKNKGELQPIDGGVIESTTDLTDQMNKIGIGITPAIGYDLNKMSFSLRYYAGLTSLAKEERDIDIKSQVLSVVVSYKVFTLKK